MLVKGAPGKIGFYKDSYVTIDGWQAYTLALEIETLNLIP